MSEITDFTDKNISTQSVSITGKRWPDGGKITQTERLFTARARYAKEALLSSEDKDLGGSRGDWGYIKLLTSNKQYEEYIGGGGKRKVKYEDLVGPGSTVAEMSDPNGEKSNGYDKFLITGVSAAMSEKMQITEVFGDNEVVYYFGRQPLIFNISGVLIDSPDNDWFTTWMKMYSEFMRGSQLAKNYELLKLVLPNMALTGTIANFSYSQDSNRDVDIPFSFQFIAKVVEPLAVNNAGMISSNKLKFINFSDVNSFVGQVQINTLQNQIANATGVIQNPTSSLYDKANALNMLGTTTGGSFGTFLESSKGTLTGFQSTIEGWTKASNNYFSSIQNSSLFQTVSSSLAGIRTNLFSPVYGILSSLAKLVSSTAGSVVGLINALVSPVRTLLRDITSISSQAIALVNLVNSSITGLGRYAGNQISGLAHDFETAIHTLGKAAGAIATAPLTIAQSIAGTLQSGALPLNPAFLRQSASLTFSRPTLALSEGAAIPTKAALLAGIIPYSVEAPSLF